MSKQKDKKGKTEITNNTMNLKKKRNRKNF